MIEKQVEQALRTAVRDRGGLCARPPGRGVPGRGWSDPWVCLAETAPPSRVNFRQIRGWGYRPAWTIKKPPRRTASQ